MKVTERLLRTMIGLLEGRSIPSSTLKGSWVEDIVAEGILLPVYSGSRKSFRLKDREAFLDFMDRQNELLRDPYRALDLLLSDASRGDLAAESGDSKTRSVRACPGFAVNSFEPIRALLNGEELTIHPASGTFLFVCDWQDFSIGEEVVVVGVENMENFRKVACQKEFFYECLRGYNDQFPENKAEVGDGGLPRLLFVSRYPKSNDLVEWLKRIPNPYFHFGDYDLEGIQIFQSEFEKYLIGEQESRLRLGSEDRAVVSMKRIVRYLIPSDIEQRLIHGSRRRYESQYAGTRNITSEDPDLSRLIELINHYRRCYDQEGYIAKPLV